MKNDLDDESQTLEEVGSTVGTFAQRLQRKLKAKAVEEDQVQRASETRTSIILKAMSSVRKALQEASRVQLGKRFSLRCTNDDWEGWPRVKLDLIDRVSPTTIKYGLIITSKDSNDTGYINISLASGELITKLLFSEASDLQKLPLSLKKALRDFLGIIEQYVLDPESPDESLEIQTRAITDNLETTPDPKLNEEDLFTSGSESNPDDKGLVDTDEPASTIKINL